MFIIEYIFTRFPRMKRRHDSTYRIWKGLPTDSELEKQYQKAAIDRVSKHTKYFILCYCLAMRVLVIWRFVHFKPLMDIYIVFKFLPKKAKIPTEARFVSFMNGIRSWLLVAFMWRCTSEKACHWVERRFVTWESFYLQPLFVNLVSIKPYFLFVSTYF